MEYVHDWGLGGDAEMALVDVAYDGMVAEAVVHVARHMDSNMVHTVSVEDRYQGSQGPSWASHFEKDTRKMQKLDMQGGKVADSVVLAPGVDNHRGTEKQR